MNSTIIIAEAGVNHNGSLDIAKQLIDEASLAGVDYIKFQTFKADKIVHQQAKQALYQIKNQDGSGLDTQYDMLKKLELSDEWHYILKDYCLEKNINFLSSAFDLDSIDFLASLGMRLFKIPSGEITNKPYLEKVATYQGQIILSTGMAEMSEIKDALDILIMNGASIDSITVLHCNTEYPTPMCDVNLHAMNYIAKELNVKVGYSDHTEGIEVPIAAVALGATIIEKHFTLNRNLPGPDHKASIEPSELKLMVKSIRNIEKAISGSGKKTISASEEANKIVVRKSLHFNKNLLEGHIIKPDDLVALRPGNGISPMNIDEVIGRKLVKQVMVYQLVERAQFT